MENKRQIGTKYENVAADYLKSKGYQILERNYRNRQGEIDIIAKKHEYLCFVEVKYRSDTKCGNPLEAVNKRKQHMISKVAKFYLVSHGYLEDTNCRFDVVAITGNEIELIENAFEYQE